MRQSAAKFASAAPVAKQKLSGRIAKPSAAKALDDLVRHIRTPIHSQNDTVALLMIEE